MPTVLLVRHGRTASNAAGVLAGWTPGVALDETGAEQAATLALRLTGVPIAHAVVSPLQRCQETAAALLATGDTPRPVPVTDDRLGECRYGDWTGQKIADLAKDPLWKVVQAHPSAVTFPGAGGEPMLGMQQRAVAAIREHDAAVRAEHGDHAVWLAVSHGDVIKAILADALGMHLDQFQRLIADPCSVSVVRYTTLRPFAVRINDSGTDLRALVPAPAPASPAPDDALDESDAVVGGTTGSTTGSAVGNTAGSGSADPARTS